MKNLIENKCFIRNIVQDEFKKDTPKVTGYHTNSIKDKIDFFQKNICYYGHLEVGTVFLWNSKYETVLETGFYFFVQIISKNDFSFTGYEIVFDKNINPPDLSKFLHFIYRVDGIVQPLGLDNTFPFVLKGDESTPDIFIGDLTIDSIGFFVPYSLANGQYDINDPRGGTYLTFFFDESLVENNIFYIDGESVPIK